MVGQLVLEVLQKAMNVEQSFPSDLDAPLRNSAIFRWIKKRVWLVLIVVLPTMLATLYFGVFASDVYVSESRFVIKSPDQKRQLSSLANLIQTTGLSGGQEQANEVLDFVRSRDALTELERSTGFRDRYSVPRIDLFARFPGPFDGDTFEELFEYYKEQVIVRSDNETGSSVITVKAFTPKDAKAINERLLELSEERINRQNERIRGRVISEAQRQVDLATARAKAASAAITKYRNSRALIDPAKQAGGVLEVSNDLVAQRAILQSQLDQMQRLAPNNPSIQALKYRIRSIETQISEQDSRIVGGQGGMASKLGDYENLIVEQEFSAQNLNVANAALVQARAEAQRQQYYLQRVVEPNLPDEPVLPRRILNVAIVAAAAMCLYLILWMLVVGILEHAPDE